MNYSYNNTNEREKLKQHFSENINRLNSELKTIVWSIPAETGTSYHRCFEPMRLIEKIYPNTFNQVYTENIQPVHVEIADLIIFHRASEMHKYIPDVLNHWPMGKKKPISIHEVDDNEYNLPKYHPMREMWYATGKDKMSKFGLAHADFVTTTTRLLASEFRKTNPLVKVFRNCLDWDLPQWKVNNKQQSSKIVIGWAGLTSHFKDIMDLHPILKEIHDKYDNIIFELWGMPVRDMANKITKDADGQIKIEDQFDIKYKDTYRAKVEDKFSDFNKDRLNIFKAVPLEEYGKIYSRFDINLAYVDKILFNKCKSEIKIVEAFHYGIPNIFTNFGGYYDFVRNLPLGLKQHANKMLINTNTQHEWVQKISYWIENKQSRKDVGELFKTYVDDEYNLKNNVKERIEFYKSLLRNKIN